MKNIGIVKFPMVLLFMNLVQRNGAKENCRICSDGAKDNFNFERWSLDEANPMVQSWQI